MAVKMNLLPPEYAVSGGLARVLKTTRMLGVIALAIFVVFALGLAGFFVFSSFELRSLTAGNDGLKGQITALSSSEQQMILLRDRLKKIRTVQTTASSAKNLSSVDPIVAAISGNITLTELAVDPQKVDISVVIRSNSDLTTFLKNLKSSEAFKSVVLTSFGFNPVSGYLANIRLI